MATVAQGGETDTNGCIAGALLGAVHGEPAALRPRRRSLASGTTAGPLLR